MCEFCEIYECAKSLAEGLNINQNYYAVLQERTVLNGKEKRGTKL